MWIVAAARRPADGMMGGYSCLATLQIVRSDFPEHRALHTWTDPGNAAMYRTNADFGYVARERMHDVQRKDA